MSHCQACPEHSVPYVPPLALHLCNPCVQTILDSWTAGNNLVSGRAINSKTALDYCSRLRNLLTRVPEVLEVLGQDQVQAMLQQVAATSAQLSGEQSAQCTDRRAATAAAAAATAAGGQPAASAGSVGSLAAISRLLSAAGDTADNTAGTGSADMGAAAAAGDAGSGGDAAGDVCDMQLDVDPSEAATPASPAPAPAPTTPAAPPTPAAATAHPAPAASPATSPAAAAAAARAAAAAPDPATFDLEQLYQVIKQRVDQGVLQDKRAADKWMKPIGPLPKLVTGNLNRKGVLLSTLPQHFQVRPSCIGALTQRLPDQGLTRQVMPQPGPAGWEAACVTQCSLCRSEPG